MRPAVHRYEPTRSPNDANTLTAALTDASLQNTTGAWPTFTNGPNPRHSTGLPERAISAYRSTTTHRARARSRACSCDTGPAGSATSPFTPHLPHVHLRNGHPAGYLLPPRISVLCPAR